MRVIFLDFDGVILESNHIKDDAFRHAFKEYPHKIDEIMAYHRSVAGLIRFKKFEYIVSKILHEAYDAAREEQLALAFAAHVQEAIAVCPFVRGAQDFLEHYWPKVPMYVVSVNPAKDLSQTLERRDLARYFKGVFATEEKAQAIEAVLTKEGCPAADAVFIGDSPTDHEAALRAGVRFIGRQSGYFKPPFLFDCFDDLGSVKEYLMKKEF